MCLVRKILLASLVLLAGCKQEVSPFTFHHNQRVEELEADNKTYSVVFLGDSLTEMGDFESVIPDSKNAGVIGDPIWCVPDVMQYVMRYKPRKLFLMIGINSLRMYSLEESKTQYKELVNLVAQYFPDTEVILESVLPHAQGYKVIKLFNEYVKQTAEEKGFKYLDLYSLYAVDDKLPQELTEDGLHLKKEAYSVWYEAIKEDKE